MKKYTSMQQELAARRAAENRDAAAQEGKQTATRRESVPFVQGEKWTFVQERKQTSARGKRQSTARERKTSFSRPKLSFRSPEKQRLAARKIGVLILVTLITLAIVFCTIAYLALIPSTGDPDPTEQTWQPNPTEQTEPTSRASEPTTYPTVPPKGTLGERSSLSDIEEYAAKHTTPTADEDALFGDPYMEILKIADKEKIGNNWYISDGRIYFWFESSRHEDPTAVRDRLVRVSDSIRGVLKDYSLDDTPVIGFARERKNWFVRLVLIDGETVFSSDGF